MTFTLLIYQTSASEAVPEAVRARALEQHRALQRESGEDLLAVARLDATRSSTAFRHDGERMPAVDGPYMEAKEWLVGFYLLECDSEEQAHERARQICTPNHVIEVRPTVWHAVP